VKLFNITLESKPPGSTKWQKLNVETSHWPSAEHMLTDAQMRFTGHELRLIAELVDEKPCE